MALNKKLRMVRQSITRAVFWIAYYMLGQNYLAAYGEMLAFLLQTGFHRNRATAFRQLVCSYHPSIQVYRPQARIPETEMSGIETTGIGMSEIGTTATEMAETGIGMVETGIGTEVLATPGC